MYNAIPQACVGACLLFSDSAVGSYSVTLEDELQRMNRGKQNNGKVWIRDCTIDHLLHIFALKSFTGVFSLIHKSDRHTLDHLTKIN